MKSMGIGGAEGNRTPDLCSAIAALSHLSYSPSRRPVTLQWDEEQRRQVSRIYGIAVGAVKPFRGAGAPSARMTRHRTPVKNSQSKGACLRPANGIIEGIDFGQTIGLGCSGVSPRL